MSESDFLHAELFFAIKLASSRIIRYCLCIWLQVKHRSCIRYGSKILHCNKFPNLVYTWYIWYIMLRFLWFVFVYIVMVLSLLLLAMWRIPNLTESDTFSKIRNPSDT